MIKIKYKNYLLASQIIFLFGLYWAIKKSLYFYKLALARSDKIKALKNLVDLSYEQNLLKKINTQDKLNNWLDKTHYKNIYILSFDKIRLYASIIKQKKQSQNKNLDFNFNFNFNSNPDQEKNKNNNLELNNWVIIIHGYNGFGLQMLDIAEKFYNAGFNIILPDCRGHGKSGGDYIGMGWHDRLDILEWIKFIIKNHPDAKIILYGLSMGGAAVLMTSGENLPNNIKCIIEDCGYTSVFDEFAYHYNKIFKLPSFLLNITDFICRTKAGYKLSEASAINQLKKSKTPILFIHGEQDKFVPTSMVYKLYDTAKCPKDILIIPKAGHGISYKIDSKRYWQKIFAFTKKYLF